MTDKPKTIDIGAVRAEFGDCKGDSVRSFEVPPWAAEDYSNLKEGMELPEKIKDEDIQCHWSDWKNGHEIQHDDTVKSMRLVAEKINAILDYLKDRNHG